MDSLSNIVEYIDNMKIRSAVFGGFDKESVYGVIQDISSMYQKHISDLQRENSKLKAQLDEGGSETEAEKRRLELSLLSAEAGKREAEEALASKDLRIAELTSKLEEAPADTSSELEEAKATIESLKAQLEKAKSTQAAAAAEVVAAEVPVQRTAAPAYEEYYKERFDLLDSAIKAVKESEARALAEAEQKAEKIVTDAQAEADKIVRDSHYEVLKAEKQIRELQSAKRDIDYSFAAITDDLKEVYLKAEEIRKKASPASYGYQQVTYTPSDNNSKA